MFDIGWQEIFLIAVLALIVVGPKDLPRALKTVMASVRKVKGMARDFQSGLDDIVRETELADMRREIEEGTAGDIRKEIENTIDPNGDLSKDMKDLQSDLDSATQEIETAKKTAPETDKSLKEASEELEAPPVTQVADLPAAPMMNELEAPAVEPVAENKKE